MTDLPIAADSIPSRLGVALSLTADGRLTGTLTPAAAICDRGVVPAYALVFLADVAAGVPSDTDADSWTFTSDISVRAPLGPPPASVSCTSTPLRSGARSTTCDAPLLVDGAPWGHCFVGFSRVPRREGDLPKPPFDAASLARRPVLPPLEAPLRAVADFRSIDPAQGVVGVEVRPDLRNPAGALQGAMVAGLAEAAAEDLADHLGLLGTDRHVVTDLEVRFLAQNRASPIRTRAWVLGPAEDGLVRIDLVDDDGRGRLTTSVLARVRPAPG